MDLQLYSCSLNRVVLWTHKDQPAGVFELRIGNSEAQDTCLYGFFFAQDTFLTEQSLFDFLITVGNNLSLRF